MNTARLATDQLTRIGSWVDRRARHLLGPVGPRLDSAARQVLRGIAGPYSDPDGRCLVAPDWLVLGINNFCDLKCKMCDVGLGDDATVFWKNLIGDDPRNMSLAMLGQILDGAEQLWPRPKIGLAFTEPLLHKQIVEIVSTIVRRGFFASLTTNGSQLPRLADPLVEAGLQEITISVDGPAAIHDKIRGRQGTFDKLYAGVERLNAARQRSGRPHPVVRLSFTVLQDNYLQIADFIQAVVPLRPASINISLQNFITEEMAGLHNGAHGGQFGGALRVTPSNLGAAELSAIDIAQLQRELARALELHHAGGAQGGAPRPPIQLVPSRMNDNLLSRYYGHPLDFIGSRRCTDPFSMMMIRTDGTVIPAHGRCFDLEVGRVGQSSLPEIWNSDTFRAFRRLLLENGGTLPACARCCGIIGKMDRQAA
jgi:MoaA/NifB/PqqE/SkfB family radical SAM enzyme